MANRYTRNRTTGQAGIVAGSQGTPAVAGVVGTTTRHRKNRRKTSTAHSNATPFAGGGQSSIATEMTYAGYGSKFIWGLAGQGMPKASILRNFNLLLDTIVG